MAWSTTTGRMSSPSWAIPWKTGDAAESTQAQKDYMRSLDKWGAVKKVPMVSERSRRPVSSCTSRIAAASGDCPLSMRPATMSTSQGSSRRRRPRRNCSTRTILSAAGSCGRTAATSLVQHSHQRPATAAGETFMFERQAPYLEETAMQRIRVEEGNLHRLDPSMTIVP